MGTTTPPPATHPAGWYPDPVAGDPTLLRYWDGAAWTTHTARVGAATPTPGTTPTPTTPATNERARRRWLVPVKWGALGAFALAAIVVGVALASGQQVKEVDPSSGKITFYSSDRTVDADVARAEIEGSQDEIDERLDELESDVRSAAPADPAVDVADFGGTWTGSNGLTYQIDQYGDLAVIQELSPFGVSAYGEGTIVGGSALFTFTAYDGTIGEAALSMVDADTITGEFVNYTWGSSFATMTRS